jgi:hypothetical protein
MAQKLVIHRIPARKGAECELDVVCSQRAEDGSRCREVLGECPNTHAPRDGQDRGVVPRSVDRSASARRCERTASKSGAIRPIRPLRKLHDVGVRAELRKRKWYVRRAGFAGLCTHASPGLCGQSPFHGRRASVEYRLPPQCWLRRATNRIIHLEPVTGRGHIGKPEHQEISPRCLCDYGFAAGVR